MQKELTFTKHTRKEAEAKGLPVFNGCNHYEIDMSHLRGRHEDGHEDWMNTIVVKLPFGNALTLCVMQTGGNEVCIDSAFHGDNLDEHRVYAMGGGQEKDTNVYNKNIYALIAKAKEIK
ncbi:hypothetical protein M5X00_26430 [Paenibacillus alvei]|uniref:hypothetical protein n=1 Tax=Paenibacillus alvei TaxID=44250 RepID=UPI0002893326|nr:hypothetical protein [Paenibacillus alvei]EJW14060.1 hypothetical protein PAV_141p01660 [Paenibacillus alvei DSM 29]MCY9544888.1 hypothetical protein [Paenibacillus alvei]MCY9707789.1 hypothetical protein [Paenibacillus alvei]MCY9757770.1 hypothetical protein [Paenibacillus alvei]MEC0082699.1 hypothetical protein [Paenibacillus alvei]